MAAGGNLQRNLVVESLYETDALSSKIEGLVGDPVNFDTTSDFKEATLTFKVDKTKLAEGVDFDNLAVLWYDEVNQAYELIPSAIDAEKSTVTATVNHFSKYMVVDGSWFNITMKALPNYLFGTHMYAVIDGLLPNTPKRYCEDRGGHLVTITSAEEQAHIFNLAASTGNHPRYFIGLERDETAPGGFKWMADEPYGSYTSWAPGEPKNPVDSQVARMHGPNEANSGQWYTYIGLFEGFNYWDCGYICEWEDYASFQQASSVLDKDGDGLPDFMETGGIPLPNGKIVYTDPNKADTDGDGILDGDEIAIKMQIVDWDEAHNPIYGFTGFIFRSDPVAIDSDGDGVVDSKDASPYLKNAGMNYIFYDKNRPGDKKDPKKDFTEKEALRREKLFKKEHQAVTMIVADSVDDFANKWNQMGLDRDGKEEYKISNVYTVYHGYIDRFTIRTKNPELKLTDGERIFFTSDASRLSNKKIDVLNLSSCMNGNLDFINQWAYYNKDINDFEFFKQNMAIMMMKGRSNIKTVKAWDGVAFYIPIGSGIQFDSQHRVFQEWSAEKNGKTRNPSGLITYTRASDGSLSYSPAVKYFYVSGSGSIPVPEEMTETIS